MKHSNFTRLSNSYQGQEKSQNNSIEVMIMNISAVYIRVRLIYTNVTIQNILRIKIRLIRANLLIKNSLPAGIRRLTWKQSFLPASTGIKSNIFNSSAVQFNIRVRIKVTRITIKTRAMINILSRLSLGLSKVRICDTLATFLVRPGRLYLSRPAWLLCPVLAIITLSSTPCSFSLVVTVALNDLRESFSPCFPRPAFS